MVRHEEIYQAIKEEHQDHGYPITALCKLGKVNRAVYYKWLHRDIPAYEAENQRIADEIEKIHTKNPEKGYRRIRDDLERYHEINVNDKRVLRICRIKGIKSTIKHASKGCSRQAANPEFIAENILNREFSAEAPNQKWLTDVTEFKYYIGIEVHKIYLSAILDHYDRRIVSYVIGDSNDNPLVFETFEKAITENPGATPLCHSDRGFQYTNRVFHAKLDAAGMKQSMSRVAKCIDNGPMEGFWGILKRERYYGRRFTDKNTLISIIEDYIEYYNNKRLQ
nr:IS3 family transposase [Sellimonas intestinalis]